MNKNILNACIVSSLAMGLASCSENTWNDHYLDGFVGGVDYENTEDGTYTLTDDNYSAIASLMKDLAGDDKDLQDAAKAIGSNFYFDMTGPYPANVAIPAFLETSSFPYYLASNGSKVDITYREAFDIPAAIGEITNASKFAVPAQEYQKIWGSDVNFIQAFAPSTATPQSVLPSLLKAAYPDATEGTYAIANFNMAPEDPDFDAGTTYFSEPFATSIGNFTTQDIILPTGSSYVWKFDAYNNPGYMKASAYVNRQNHDSDSWLISPEIDIPADANASLSFEQAWNNYKADFALASEQNTVAIRIAGTTDWTKLIPENLPQTNSWDFVNSGKIDLSAYNGKKIQIGFRYTSTPEQAGTTELRNVKIASGIEPVMDAQSIVYQFNGTSWIIPSDVSSLTPADYAAMGAENNKLSSPEIYIPIYLKNKLIYAQSGASHYVFYNGSKVDQFLFNGTEWTLNNNGLRTVVGRYQKKDDEWSFVKYVGEAIFNEFTDSEIKLDRSYLFVSGSICAALIDKNKTYGYPGQVNVSIVDGEIKMSSEENAYTFLSAYMLGETEIKAPEGLFMIRDSEGRYMYMSGTYNSPNLAKAPVIKGNDIDNAYLWKATRNADGTWAIVNTSNDRMLLYSVTHKSFGVYDGGPTADRLAPELYIMAE